MSPSFADDITPSGVQNSVNQTFTLPESPNPAVSLQLTLNGILQDQGTDYTLVGNVITYIHVAPAPSDVQLAFFRYPGVLPPPATSQPPTPTLVTPIGATSRDDFSTLSRRLLNRAPAVGIVLARQFINDSWHELQAVRQWSWRRGSGTFAPPTLYNVGYASTNAGIGQPTLITGVGTSWTPSMVGVQIRIGGLLYPFYTIVGWLSTTSLLIDQPWAGNDVTNQSYTIQQVYFPVPLDFNYFLDDCVVSIKDGYRLWTTLTQAELDMMDPQRTNFGQTYAVVFRDYSTISAGVVYPPLPMGSYPANPACVTTGYTYPASASYLVQIQTGGLTGTATFVWTRIGTTGFSFPLTTQTYAQPLSDGVQIYFPDGAMWTAGNSWIINAQPTPMTGGPRYELWPGPTYSAYLYPYLYIKKEYDLTDSQPQLPPFISNRGEILLEMGLGKCAEFPGADADHPNPYYNLKQAVYHANKVDRMLVDLERNDEEIGVTNISYEMYPMYPSPWMDGRWQQSHAPFLG